MLPPIGLCLHQGISDRFVGDDLEPMSLTTKEIARRFIRVWNAGQIHIVDELAAPDLTVSYTHFPEAYRGLESFKAMLSRTHQYFPDLVVEVKDVVAEGDQAVVHWAYRGTFQEGELFGVSASGQSVEVTGMTVYQVADGSVRSEWGMVDNFALMMQLGAEPRPRGEA